MIYTVTMLLGLEQSVYNIVSVPITSTPMSVLMSVFKLVVPPLIVLAGVYVTIRNNTGTNLKANARVNWIQTVRTTSTELISSYYKILSYKGINKEELFKNLIESQFKTELLILYFGPEVNKYGKYIKLSTDSSLGHLTKNKGKNDAIIDFLSSLNKEFHDFYSLILDTENDMDNDIDIYIEKTKDLYKENRTEMKIEERIKPFPILKDKCDDEEKTEYYKLVRDNLSEKLVCLRDIMRIYLKIEWNKAKRGK